MAGGGREETEGKEQGRLKGKGLRGKRVEGEGVEGEEGRGGKG